MDDSTNPGVDGTDSHTLAHDDGHVKRDPEHSNMHPYTAGQQRSGDTSSLQVDSTNSESVPDAGVSKKSLELSSYFATESTSEDPFEAVFSSAPHVLLEPSSTAEKPQKPVTPPPLTQPTSDKPTALLDTSTLNRLRQRDAWLPSEATKSALLQPKAQRTSGPSDIKPILCSKVPPDATQSSTDSNKLADPYRSLLLNYLQDEATVDALRHVPNPIEQTTLGPENLKELISSGWYRVALDVTYRLLSNWGYREDQGGAMLTPFTAQIWLARLALLVRIRNYDVAQRELATFGTLDAPNVYFENSPELYPGRVGSIIPFSLRLLHAELPFHLGRSEEALDRLYHLVAIIGRIQSNLRRGFTEDGSTNNPEPGYKEASLSIWTRREVRVLSSCLSIYLAELDYQAALDTIHQLAITCSTSPGVLRGLASIMGRIYLQMGDLETAKYYFERALIDAELKHQPVLNRQKLLNQAFLCIGRNEYEEAMKLFQQVLELDPTNVPAANNMAVCCLYLGQLSTAIRLLETLSTTGFNNGSVLDGATTSNTTRDSNVTASIDGMNRRRFCLHDTLVFNLAVLYEVESDRASEKKLRLLKHLASLPGEPVHVSALKLPLSS